MKLFSRKQTIAGQKLPLIHVYTFKTGEKLYTYNQDDYGKISSRYWKALNEKLNYITMYQTDKNTWINMVNSIQDRCKSIVNGGDATTLAMDIYSALEMQKSLPMQKTAVQLKLHEVLFCMFFLLAEEIEGGYNEAMNKKKLDLINSDETAKDNFFFHVSEILNNLEISYEKDIPKMITEIYQLLEANPEKANTQ